MFSSPALVRFEAASFLAGDTRLLDRIDLIIKRGDIICLIGPNGAGKTTLVRLLLGILQPSEGQVIRAPGLKLGYLPQKIQIDQTLPLSVGRLLALNNRAGRDEIERALARTGASGLASRQAAELSGGELRRVLLARALLTNPDLLVLDEPTAGLDINGQLEFFSLIESLQEESALSVLFVSHDLHIVMSSTKEVVCLNRHICCSGQPEKISRHPAYLALFGPASEKLAIYHHHHDHHHDLSGKPQEP